MPHPTMMVVKEEEQGGEHHQQDEEQEAAEGKKKHNNVPSSGTVLGISSSKNGGRFGGTSVVVKKEDDDDAAAAAGGASSFGGSGGGGNFRRSSGGAGRHRGGGGAQPSASAGVAAGAAAAGNNKATKTTAAAAAAAAADNAMSGGGSGILSRGGSSSLSFDDVDDRHERSMEFTNYDVLLAKANDGSILLDTTKGGGSHVGNNRFQVLLNMNRNEFEQRSNAGESTHVVVRRIVNTVCNQCQPNGRFLMSEGHGSWMVLKEEEVMIFVTDYLTDPDSQRSLMTNPNALTASVLVPSSGAAAGTRISSDELFGGGGGGNDSQRKNNGNGGMHQQPPSYMRATIATAPSSGGGSGDLAAVGEKKRRRRSSLLRRSVSERGSTTTGADGKKKLAGRMPSITFPKNWIPKFGISGGPAKVKPGRLDVVFDAQLTQLCGQNPGNNRLAVLVNMKRNGYINKTSAEKDAIVKEISDAITVSYKGRFLALKPEGSPAPGSYVVLSDVSGGNFGGADPSSPTSGEDQIACALDALLSNPEPIPVGVASAATPSSSAASQQQPVPAFVGSGGGGAGGTESSIKDKTLQALHQVKPPSEEVQNMRSAAIASLQKRKKRQGLTAKIRNMASRGGGGGGASAAPIGGMSTSTSSLTGVNPNTTQPQPVMMQNFGRTTSAPVTMRQQHHHQQQYPVPIGSSATASVPQMGLQMARSLPQQQLFNHRQASDSLLYQPQQQQQYFSNNNNMSMEPLPLAPSSAAFKPRGSATLRQQQPTQNPQFGVGSAVARASTSSQLSEGMIEDLLSGLDVSGDLPPPRMR